MRTDNLPKVVPLKLNVLYLQQVHEFLRDSLHLSVGFAENHRAVFELLTIGKVETFVDREVEVQFDEDFDRLQVVVHIQKIEVSAMVQFVVLFAIEVVNHSLLVLLPERVRDVLLNVLFSHVYFGGLEDFFEGSPRASNVSDLALIRPNQQKTVLLVEVVILVDLEVDVHFLELEMGEEVGGTVEEKVAENHVDFLHLSVEYEVLDVVQVEDFQGLGFLVDGLDY